MTNRELADAIDELCRIRAEQAARAWGIAEPKSELEEKAEVLVRMIADGFTERDPRQGVITSGRPGFS